MRQSAKKVILSISFH